MAVWFRTAWASRSTVFFVISALSFATAPRVAGHHILEGGYPNRGYVWLQHWYNGTILVTSDDCNPREIAAFDRVLDSTAGKAEFDEFWRDGIMLIRESCDGVVTSEIDIKITYGTFDGSFWGKNTSDDAPETWCDMWNKPYPCGSHPSRVKIHMPYWTDHDGEPAWKEKLIMHETGHSLGMAHHCKDTNGNDEDSVMNTPAGDGSACTEENWTNVMSWKSVDRLTHISIYPNWQGP